MNKIIKYSFIIITALSLGSCQDEAPQPQPQPHIAFSELKVTTDFEEVTLQVVITNKNTPENATCGFVLSTQHNPTIQDTRVEVQKDDTTYKAKLKNLEEKKTYYIRAYMQKSITEYAYSDEVSFTTPALKDRPTIMIKGGSYMMGSPKDEPGFPEWHVNRDECPMHQVTLKDFRIDAKEVTYEQYCKFLNTILENPDNDKGIKLPKDIISWIYTGKNGSPDCGIQFDGKKYIVKEGKNEYPAGWIRFPGAVAYAKWVGGRLPSESEWEYASLGGNQSKGYRYAGSNDIEEVAWYELNSGDKVHPVAQKKPNELGLYDMSGNVGEWCEDTYHLEDVGYQGAPNDGSAWTEGGRGHIIRGGSFQSEKWDCRSKYRTYNAWYYCGHNVGFRVVYDIK
ncbi:formylglycine-generating enzyme family protein [Porphyromonas pogonae]|uniref:formylglycine-generating enzyme family protein n=1 Tax=Porphyromonas pogonae TaxID=867595 RepID=UPI002E79EE2A|nr:formylglycine-generating enzyme family protein [Porphyromonas pogonae]